MSAQILRSYQVFGADDQILTAAVEAVKKAVKDAKSQSKVQRVELCKRGYRQDIEVGEIFVVPASVCNSPEDFPTILLSANLRQHTTGEGMIEFQMGALADPKELSREALQAFKKVCFTDAKGDIAPLIVFAATWAHPSSYQSFTYDEDGLLAKLRDVAYASPFDPSLSSVFDQLRATDHDQTPLVRIRPVTQHMFKIAPSDEQDYPELLRGLDVAEEEGKSKSKKASFQDRPVIRVRAAAMPELEKESLSDDELDLFGDIDDQVQQALKKGAVIEVTHSCDNCGATLDKETDKDQILCKKCREKHGVKPDKAKNATSYKDTGPRSGEYADPGLEHTALRSQPDYGEEGTKETVDPSQVDGLDPKTAGGHYAYKTDKGIVCAACAKEKEIKGKRMYKSDWDLQNQSCIVCGKTLGRAAGGFADARLPKKAGEEPDQITTIGLAPGLDTKVDAVALKGVEKLTDVPIKKDAAGRPPTEEEKCKACHGTGKDEAKTKAWREKTPGAGPKAYIKCWACNGNGLEPSYPKSPKKGSFTNETVHAANSFVEHYAGQVLPEAQLKSELAKVTDDLKGVVIFMRDQGLLVPFGPSGYKVMNADLKDEALHPPPKLAFIIRNASHQVWAAEDVEGVILGGEWSDDHKEAARFASKIAAQDEIRRHALGSAKPEIVPKECNCKGDCACRVSAAKTAGGWWNPGSVLEQFYPEIQHEEVNSPYLSQQEGPYINPFGAPGKETASDPNAAGLSQGLDQNEGGIPLRQENNFYGPEYARNFYAPHADISPAALTLKKHPLAASVGKMEPKQASHQPKQADKIPSKKYANNPFIKNRPGNKDSEGKAAPWVIIQKGSGKVLSSHATKELAEKSFGAMEKSKHSSLYKQADKSMSLFKGLDLSFPEEEHPQAFAEETVRDAEPGHYNEPVAEDAVPQDAGFLSMDKLLKGVVAAYAAQLISAFQVTTKPITLSIPFDDKLDLHATLEIGGGPNATALQADAAKAQFDQAMDKLSDSQKKMLIDNAYAQAAVWCPNVEGSGGFNYEVFVRAESIDGPILAVRVVTGMKAAK